MHAGGEPGSGRFLREAQHEYRREAEVHQQPQIRIGSVYEKFSALHYNDWQSLFALTEEKVAELIPDATMRKKFHLLIGNLSRNDSR